MIRDLADLIDQLTAVPWPMTETDAVDRLRSSGLEPGPLRDVTDGGLRSGPLGGLPPTLDATWWVGRDGLALNMFVATTTPTSSTELAQVFRECVTEFDRRWPGIQHVTSASWRIGDAVLELDRVSGHPETGVVQLHLRAATTAVRR